MGNINPPARREEPNRRYKDLSQLRVLPDGNLGEEEEKQGRQEEETKGEEAVGKGAVNLRKEAARMLEQAKMLRDAAKVAAEEGKRREQAEMAAWQARKELKELKERLKSQETPPSRTPNPSLRLGPEANGEDELHAWQQLQRSRRGGGMDEYKASHAGRRSSMQEEEGRRGDRGREQTLPQTMSLPPVPRSRPSSKSSSLAMTGGSGIAAMRSSAREQLNDPPPCSQPRSCSR
eukprot:758341-Hanusia_phi.AAC.1